MLTILRQPPGRICHFGIGFNWGEMNPSKVWICWVLRFISTVFTALHHNRKKEESKQCAATADMKQYWERTDVRCPQYGLQPGWRLDNTPVQQNTPHWLSPLTERWGERLGPVAAPTLFRRAPFFVFIEFLTFHIHTSQTFQSASPDLSIIGPAKFGKRIWLCYCKPISM